MPPNSIVTETAKFVTAFLARRDARWALYHNFRHTTATVAACRRIGKAVGLNPDDLEVVTIAAWFHDTGYTVRANGHEVKSSAIARKFLARKRYAGTKVRMVLDCIMATKVPQRPRTLRERVMCDADMASLGQSTFMVQNDLLRREIAEREKRTVDVNTWLWRTYFFLRSHRFHTTYGRTVLERGRQRNLAAIGRRLRRTSRRIIVETGRE